MIARLGERELGPEARRSTGSALAGEASELAEACLPSQVPPANAALLERLLGRGRFAAAAGIDPVRALIEDCEHWRLHQLSRRSDGAAASAFERHWRGYANALPDTAAHLVDRVLPEAPVRQWLLSYPWRCDSCWPMTASCSGRC